ncbi:MAG TPA: glycerol-3-phosphate dehydrogenase/oxidase [Candidatus Binataceae bacterium]|nr:glycerol-3-phosphate dehydrogenase/oxidase [Candidatus Binataceae bacterium]
MTPDEHPLNRARALERLRSETFDLAIIGAGINGAAVARDAAMRGLSVALVDRGDFAGGTSSRSSKLIHGGLRYLPQGQLKLVYQALRERERLRRRTAPHLVKPIRFLFPIYRGRGFGRFTMSMGLWLYDLFARTPRAEWHRNLSAARVREFEPALARAGLTGGSLYFDAWADDARITFENILDAAIHGAAIANYLSVEGFGRDAAGRLCAMVVKDFATGASFDLRARRFVNAAGPWVDQIRRMDDPAVKNCVRLTKGVHLVFARTALPVHDALVLADESGRIVFVMPHGSYVLVGTTDTDYHADPAAVAADRTDVAYLLGVLGESLPGIKLSVQDIASSFAGLRALVKNGADANSPSSISREEVVIESSSGMLTVAGGKLTTHRGIAEKLVTRVMKDLGRSPGICPTRDTPLPGARADDTAGARADAEALATLPRAAREILLARYGTRAGIPAQIAATRSDLAAPLAPGCPVLAAEVIHAVRNEMVSCLADFMVRRSAMVWRYPVEAEAAADAVVRLMAPELGWDAARAARELAGFRADMTRRRAPG